MRFRDWSSDVCSSDLLHWRRGRRRAVRRRRRWSASCGERPCECLFELIVLDDLRGWIDMLARADPAHAHGAAFVAGGFDSSEARRVGTEWVSTCRYGWWAYN